MWRILKKLKVELPYDPEIPPLGLLSKGSETNMSNKSVLPHSQQHYSEGMHAKSLKLCPSLCDPMECGPPGSSVHEILQAKILEWVAMPSFRGSAWPRNGTTISYLSCTGSRALYH